jgi:restriction system protein
VGLFDRIGSESDACKILADEWIGGTETRIERIKWKSAQSMLAKYHTREAAEKSSVQAHWRLEDLRIAEPEPVLGDFLPSDWTPSSRGPHLPILTEMQRRCQAELIAYNERERLRLEEIEHFEARIEQLRADELAARLVEQQALWPRNVVLAAAVAKIDGIESQVAAHNHSIDRAVEALCDVLKVGLSALIEDSPADSPRHARPSAVDGAVLSQRAEDALSRLPHGLDFEPKVRAAYLPESRQVVVEFELPDVTIVPKAKSYRYIKSRNLITETARPASQIKTLYANVIAQMSLLCLAAIFTMDTARDIEVVAFNGVVDTIDPRSGQGIRPCLVTVRVTRDVFAGINLRDVDAQACLKHLSAAVSKSPTELVAVKPVLEFSMADPRFVTATDAIGALDERPNLLALTPTEFEGLIQNLFTAMGLEAKQTRASRDGGVDCVAYDTRPIFGGKIVIQAKRYKNTVGVSAVRDLYGTLQNEGASKGILVTTSSYGPASYEFANNKPIELIEGANLLYLLETYAGVIARIDPPEDWHDPVPDSSPV